MVWLILNGSYVFVVGFDEVVKNMDGLIIYVDLVSLLIEENYDGCWEVECLVDKYGVWVVGVILLLNFY